MKLLLLLLAGVAFGQGTVDSECMEGEFMNDGYTMGQNIELDYDVTAMSIGEDGNSLISVGFLVPKMYTHQVDAAAYAITFNRNHDVTEGLVKDTTVGTDTNNDNACFTNRYVNETECSLGLNEDVWVNNGPTGDSACVDQTVMTIGWTEAMTNGAFGSTSITDDGTVTRVYVTATVETWAKFDQSVYSDPMDYKGQMNGDQQTNFGGEERGRVGTHGRSGTHYGDGGDLDVEFGPLVLNDWRYTLYQIPFYIVFPKTVIVETTFQTGTQAFVLNGVVSQDVITINFNPSKSEANNFAVLDVVVQLQVPHPYAIRDPQDPEQPMFVTIGGRDSGRGYSKEGQYTHAESITFESYDDPSSCGNTKPGAQCVQNFKMRIVPNVNEPCSVAGEYYLEFWAICIQGGDNHSQGGPSGCTLDKETTESELGDPGTIGTARSSNGYFDLVFTVDHQSFCPEVMDTVHVAVDLKAYHDEGFSQEIMNDYNGRTTDYNTNEDVVYSNDIIYYEATYRTASEKSQQTIQNNEFDDSNGHDGELTGLGNDDIIDYVRAIKIFVDVYLGIDKDGSSVMDLTENVKRDWSTDNWEDNVTWTLGGSRIPLTDFDDSETTVTGARILTVPTNQPSDFNHWTMIMCEVAYIDPEVPIMTGVKPDDCFTAESTLAHEYFDFDKVMRTKSNEDGNTIDENEIAFKMRMDERVIPVGPRTDNSHVTITIESEVYYTGNQHPTRRRLQTGEQLQRQVSSKSMMHRIYYKGTEIESCDMDENLDEVEIDVVFDYDSSNMKAPENVNEANNWAMNLKMKLESHLDVKNAISITKVEKCVDKDCTMYLSTKPVKRRMELEGEKVYASLVVKSTKDSKAREPPRCQERYLGHQGREVR